MTKPEEPMYDAEALKENVERLQMLRQIEAELSAVLDLDHVAMLALDTTVRICHADIAFVVLVDEQTVGEPEARIFRMIGPKREQIAPAGVVARVLRTGKPAFLPDVSLDPDYFPADANTRAQITLPLKGRDETIIGAINLETAHPQRFTQSIYQFLEVIVGRIAVAMDNARLYNISQMQIIALQEAYGQIKQLEQLKTDMLRIATHDLRNPLSNLLGFLELLEWEQETLSQKQQDFVKNMRLSALRMKRIIEDILALDRDWTLRAGKTLQDTLDLRDIVSVAYQQSRPEADQRQHQLALTLPNAPVMVLGDMVQLHEAVINLIINAMKYTPDGGQIAVTLDRIEGQARVSVQDNGIGIAPEAQARLFEPFYRVKTSQTRSIDGTGLGLHLVKSIVERHRGSIFVESQPNVGSLFGFMLPIV